MIDNFSKLALALPLKKKKAQLLKISFEFIPKTSKRKPNLIETDDGKEFVNNLFTDLFKKISKVIPVVYP